MGCTYNLGGLKKFLYITPFSKNNVLIEDEKCEIINGDFKKIEFDLVSFSSEETIEFDKFLFTHTLTLTVNENDGYSNYFILDELKKPYNIIFESNDNEKFLFNYEFNYDITYNYEIGDNASNPLTITLTINTNYPILSYTNGITFDEIISPKPCEYNIGRITSFELAKIDDILIKIKDDGFDIEELKEDALRKIDFIKTSLTFTDELNEEGNYTQNLEFSIPFNHYFSFLTYRLMEFQQNRYIAVLRTSNNNTYILGFKQGLFPSYTINTEDEAINTIDFSLTTQYTNFSTIATNNLNIIDVDPYSWKALVNRCVDGLYTSILLRKYNSDGTPTNKYACHSDFYDEFKAYDIESRYNSPWTNEYGIKLYNAAVDCGGDICKINGVPTVLNFHDVNVKRTFTISTPCSYTVRNFATDIIQLERSVNTFTVTSLAFGKGYVDIIGEDARVYRITVNVNSDMYEFEGYYEISGAKQELSLYLSHNTDEINGFTKTTSYPFEWTIGSINNQLILSFPLGGNEIRRHKLFVDYTDFTREAIIITQDRIYTKLVVNGQEECDNEGNKWLVADKFIGYSEDNINEYVGTEKLNETKRHCEECLTDIISKTLVDNVCYHGFNYDIYSLINIDNVEYFDAQRNEYSCDDGTPYLHFNADDYFNLNYIPKYNSKFEIEYQNEQVASSFLFGSRTSSSSSDKVNIFFSVNNLVRYNFNASSNNSPSTYTLTKNRSTFDLSQICNIVNEEVGETSLINSNWQQQNTFNSTLPLYLGCINNNGNAEQFFKGKVYYMKIYEDDVLVHYYVPALNGDENPCLFDKITRKFITSDTESVTYNVEEGGLEEWIINENNSECVNGVSYYKEFLNINGFDLFDFQKVSNHKSDKDICDVVWQYEPTDKQYMRFRRVPLDEYSICDGYDYYSAKLIEYYDIESGQWLDYGQYVQDELIETDSRHCGYSNLVYYSISSNISGSSITLANEDGYTVNLISRSRNGDYNGLLESDNYKFVKFNDPILPQTYNEYVSDLPNPLRSGFSQPTEPFKCIVHSYSLPTSGQPINQSDVINALEETETLIPTQVECSETWISFDNDTRKLTIQPNDTRKPRTVGVVVTFGVDNQTSFILTQNG